VDIIKIRKSDLFDSIIPSEDHSIIKSALEKQLSSRNRVIAVLDDDPTGIQTVHGINVYMDWSQEILLKAFENESLFYIQTNSRAMTGQQAEETNRTIMEYILYASKATKRDFAVISRSDSTLRGYYPLEPRVLKDTYEKGTGKLIDGEILIPFFPEGGRFTANDIHYVQEGEYLVGAGDTEFAKDKAFGYKNSNLRLYIEEKNNGAYKKEDVASIPLELIRKNDIEAIEKIFNGVSGFGKVVVNALTYEDLETFVLGLLKAEEKGKHFIFRTAAAFVKVYGGISNRSLLGHEDFKGAAGNNPGMVIVGSHVNKTTLQLNELLKLENVVPVEVNVKNLLLDNEMENEIKSAVIKTENEFKKGNIPVLHTSRELITSNENTRESNLKISVRVSEALTDIVARLAIKPSFIISKGGITSSYIAVKGLGIIKAKVLGQILPGIPVIMSDTQKKWPDTPYIIFPGNVGDEFALRKAVEIITGAGV